MLILMLILLFVFLILGFPLFIGMLVVPIIVVNLYFPTLKIELITQQLIVGISQTTLQAIPMFIFAADIVCRGQIAKRLLDFIDSLIGHISGGLAITLEATCMAFGAISGSAIATMVAIGKPARPYLLKAGYEDAHVISMIMSSSNLALLIPPSIFMIIYCVLTGSSVAEMFLAGILPGVILFFCFATYDYFYAKHNHIPIRQKATWKTRYKSFKKSILTLGLPVIILGGIYSGFTSPTEAAAIAVLYAMIVEIFIFKSITLKDIPKISYSTAVVTATVFVLITVGQVFAWLVSYANIPDILTNIILGPNPTALTVLFLISIFFFIACMFIDAIPAMFILIPVFYPITTKLGIDPIHLGIIVTLQSAIGGITPPFGANLFTACSIFNKKYSEVTRGIIIYLIICIVLSIIIVIFPEISLYYKYLGILR